jgi:biopolymer transport protein ExbD
MSRLAGKKAIRSFARKLAEPEVIKDLNITPMMDMMTIILVFLLKSFASSSPRHHVRPEPAGSEVDHPAQAQAGDRRDGHQEGDPGGRRRHRAHHQGGKVDPAVKRDGENGYYITPLVEILEKHARKEKKVAELTGVKWEAQLMLIADQTTPYRLLTEVLYSCGQAGYANYRLLVLKLPLTQPAHAGRGTPSAHATAHAHPSRPALARKASGPCGRAAQTS